MLQLFSVEIGVEEVANIAEVCCTCVSFSNTGLSRPVVKIAERRCFETVDVTPPVDSISRDIASDFFKLMSLLTSCFWPPIVNASDIRLPDAPTPLPLLSFSLLLLLLLQVGEGPNKLFALFILASLIMTDLFPPVENCPDNRPLGGPIGGGMAVVVLC